MTKKIVSILFIILIFTLIAVPALAVPYRGFTYDYWSSYVPAPAAYTPTKSISAALIDPSLGTFTTPQDMAVDIENNLYVLDSGNNRIVKLTKDLELIKVIDSFTYNGAEQTFANPNGIFVTDNMDIYIADTNNRRIVTLDSEGNCIKMNYGPRPDELENRYDFLPSKIVVDRAGREYVIVRNVFEGIMRFDARGRFTGFFGTILVNVSAVDWFWRLLATDAQRERQRLFIPTEFSGMDIDAYGFIYTTNVDFGDENKVKRLNPGGDDVLVNRSEQLINGAQNVIPFGPLAGSSIFTDITYRGDGMYTALDSTRGRMYTYDAEGHLLYTIGGIGTVLGMQFRPSSIESIEDTLLVLDLLRGEITIYEPTEYGDLINRAIYLQYLGNDTEAVELWREVLELHENYPLANIGVGKSLLALGENRAAMEYLRRGMDIDYYSIAFRRWRTELLRENINFILTAGLVTVILISGYMIFIKKRKVDVHEDN